MATNALVEFRFSDNVAITRLHVATDAFPENIVSALSVNSPSNSQFTSWGNAASAMAIGIFNISPAKSQFWQMNNSFITVDGVVYKWIIKASEEIDKADYRKSITVTRLSGSNEVISEHTLRELIDMKPKWEMMAYLRDEMLSVDSNQAMVIAMNPNDHKLFTDVFAETNALQQNKFAFCDLADYKDARDVEPTKLVCLHKAGNWEHVAHVMPAARASLNIVLNMNLRPIIGFRSYLITALGDNKND